MCLNVCIYLVPCLDLKCTEYGNNSYCLFEFVHFALKVASEKIYWK